MNHNDIIYQEEDVYTLIHKERVSYGLWPRSISSLSEKLSSNKTIGLNFFYRNTIRAEGTSALIFIHPDDIDTLNTAEEILFDGFRQAVARNPISTMFTIFAKKEDMVNLFKFILESW